MKNFFTILILATFLLSPLGTFSNELNIEETLNEELQKLDELRTTTYSNQTRLDNLRQELQTKSDYIQKLEKSLNELFIKLSHIDTSIESTKKIEARIQNSLTELENELLNIKEIVKRLFRVNKNLPPRSLEKIDSVIKQKLRLKKELYKHSNISLTIRNRTNKMKNETQENINDIKQTIQTHVDEIQTSTEEISFLEKEIEKAREIEAHIRSIVLSLSQTDQQEIEQKIKESIPQIKPEETTKPRNFIWPVEPLEGISAGFMDSEYEKIFGIPHLAIDIPTPTGTPIKAITDAVVLETRIVQDDSYQYIILAHIDGYQSVYGHMSTIIVGEGDLVRQGEIIGTSGGIPGTRGAGPISTGPHLHLEVIKDGNHIDPLEILD